MRVGRPLREAEIVSYADVIDAELAATVRIVEVPFLVPGSSGMTLNRTVLVRRGRAEDRRLIAHELVHVGQYAEHGVVGFLRRYLGQYLAQLRVQRRHRAAYRAMPFEIEATSLAKRWHEKDRNRGHSDPTM